MGTAHSKRRSSPDVYHRAFAGKLYRAPKGTRWTKPSVIVQAIETLAMRKGAIGLAPLRQYAVKCRDEIVVKALKPGQVSASRMPTGNVGNVFLEYAWSRFNKTGRVMSEADIMADHARGKVDRWHESLSSKRTHQKVEVVGVVNDPRKMKRGFKKAAKKAQANAAKAKALGDEVRARALAAQEKQREFASQWNAEQKLIEDFKAKQGA